jgi:hypothetical protein
LAGFQQIGEFACTLLDGHLRTFTWRSLPPIRRGPALGSVKMDSRSNGA